MNGCFFLAFIYVYLESDTTMVIAVVVSLAVLVLIVLVIVIICVQKRRRQAKLEQDLQNQRQSLNDGGSHWLMTWPTYDEFQFSKDRLKIEDELGEGQFGKVYSAWATGIVKGEEKTRVAVKTVKRGSSQETAEDFRKEMEIMMDFDHPNIVRLLGICTHDEPLYLITELMKHGDLKDYIRKARPNEMHPRPLLSIAQLVDIAAQAASGVAYLALRKFVHRDIAARNCLVGENDNQLSVKISDFGMARDVYLEEYYRRRGGTLPIRWMAPEAITDGKYTVESDVWSMGVLLWEIFVFGYQPYFGRDNEQVIGGILQGSLTLECPPLCPRSVFQLMLRCWERNPSARIKSGDVANALQNMRDSGDTYASYLDTTPTQSRSPVQEDYTPMSPVSSGAKLDSMRGEETLLPQSKNAYLDMSGGDVPSASSDQKRNTQDLCDTPASYLDMTPTQSKPPVQENYTSMSPATLSGAKLALDPMLEEKASLPQSKDPYVDMRGGDVPSASSGQKRNTYVEVPQKETFSSEGTDDANAVQDLCDTSGSYLDMTPTQSKPSVQEDYTPMSPVTPSVTEMLKQEALLPQSKDVYVDMSSGDVHSAPSDQKRNTYVEIPQREREEVEEKKEKKLSSQGSAYANISTEDLDSPEAAAETGDTGATKSGDQLSYENPSYTGIPTSGPVTGSKKDPSGEKAFENPSYTGVSSVPTTYL